MFPVRILIFSALTFCQLSFAQADTTLDFLKLSERYRIENDVLTTYQGHRYAKIAFGSHLHEELARVLRDPEQAQSIQDGYEAHIHSILPNALSESFTRAMLKVCYLFGSMQFSPESALLKAIQEEGVALSSWAKAHAIALSAFIQEANRSTRTITPPGFRIAMSIGLSS